MKHKFYPWVGLLLALLLFSGCALKNKGGADVAEPTSPEEGSAEAPNSPEEAQTADPKEEAEAPGAEVAEGYVPRYPQGGYYHWKERDFSSIVVKDSSGQDISEIAIDLWYCANDIYNVGDCVMFEMDRKEGPLLQYRIPQSHELLNYQEVVENVFTKEGIAQLEQTAPAEDGNLIIRKVDGKVYRMGQYKSGFSFAEALTAMEVKEAAENRITLTVEYAVTGFIDDENDPGYKPPEYYKTDFVIAKVDGKWLVDNYIYPEGLWRPNSQ